MELEDLRLALVPVAAKLGESALERGQRTELDRADFDALASAGFLSLGLPESRGGLWRDLATSIRGYAAAIETVAAGDPSVALVGSMHPIVLGYWLAATPPAEGAAEFEAQRGRVFDSVAEGAWWGTITSEPGSGGDILRTRAVASPADDACHRLSGEKHFGSGSGLCRYMITTARVPGEPEPAAFFLDLEGVPWDGSRGLRLLRSWDGMGMSATQSHAFVFEDFPAERIRSEGLAVRAAVACLGTLLFTAVGVSIVRLAIDWSRARLAPRRETLRAFEAARWVECENRAWLIEQAYEGALSAVERRGLPALLDALRAKQTIASLAEELMADLGRVVGGASLSRGQPLGQWAQDVRALGFLRPPWGLASDQLFDAGWSASV